MKSTILHFFSVGALSLLSQGLADSYHGGRHCMHPGLPNEFFCVYTHGHKRPTCGLTGVVKNITETADSQTVTLAEGSKDAIQIYIIDGKKDTDGGQGNDSVNTLEDQLPQEFFCVRQRGSEPSLCGLTGKVLDTSETEDDRTVVLATNSNGISKTHTIKTTKVKHQDEDEEDDD